MESQEHNLSRGSLLFSRVGLEAVLRQTHFLKPRFRMATIRVHTCSFVVQILKLKIMAKRASKKSCGADAADGRCGPGISGRSTTRSI